MEACGTVVVQHSFVRYVRLRKIKPSEMQRRHVQHDGPEGCALDLDLRWREGWAAGPSAGPATRHSLLCTIYRFGFDSVCGCMGYLEVCYT